MFLINIFQLFKNFGDEWLTSKKLKDITKVNNEEESKARSARAGRGQ